MIKLNLLLKLSYLSSNFALTLGYLNLASNNPAQIVRATVLSERSRDFDLKLVYGHQKESASLKSERYTSGIGYISVYNQLEVLLVLLSFCFLEVTGSYIACEQALLFGRAKRAARERVSERGSCEGRSRLLSRVYFSLYPPNGELARRLGVVLIKARGNPQPLLSSQLIIRMERMRLERLK